MNIDCGFYMTITITISYYWLYIRLILNYSFYFLEKHDKCSNFSSHNVSIYVDINYRKIIIIKTNELILLVEIFFSHKKIFI
jgi:uncharacterized HAD superfamily protein